MILGVFIKCFFLLICNVHFFQPAVDAGDVVHHGRMVDNPSLHHHGQELYQNSGLSEFSEDVTEKHKRKKKKIMKRRRSRNDGNVQKKPKNNKKKSKNMKKIKNGNIFDVDKRSPVDIIVHIKMNE